MRNRLKIAVCDDNKHTISILYKSIARAFDENHVDVMIDIFLSPKELLSQLEDETYNLIFLDINMPEMDGIEVGLMINKLCRATEIIYVSASEERVYDVFEVGPFDFVRKSKLMLDMTKTIKRYIRDVLNAKDYSSIIQFKQQGGILGIRVSDLKYVECVRNIQMLYTEDGGEPKRIYSRMKLLENQLVPQGFIRVHKGFLINYQFVKSFGLKNVILTSGEVIPVSRNKSHIVREEYMQLISHNVSAKVGC
ncbi:MAG: LytTR family DNA-binding domain-containing protein [Lachnospiraceae bacterium]|nr:LytTR family DNA-binding domain-containing protein [Lachnospiraceae bacterium]